ncbi:MAG: hypothetical protein KBH86_11405 [Syntrophorhabdus sp.]|nr:hypothetical protein [Syntrophorhabdus sp.]
MVNTEYIKHFFLCLIISIPLLFTMGAKALSECNLNEEDQTRFMTLYNEVVNQGKIEKIEEIHSFLRSKGCEKEIEEADRRAREILKSQGVLK